MEKKKYDPDIHHRRSIRLKNYDYSSAGLYFITMCTQNKLNLFGEIVGAGSKPALPDKPDMYAKGAGLEPAPTKNDMNNESQYKNIILNEYGNIVNNTWFDLVNHISNIKLHEFVIMPNHIHGIIEIIEPIYDMEIVRRENRSFSFNRSIRNAYHGNA